MSYVNKEFQKFNIELHLITSLDFSAVLKSFSELIASSIGPKSKFKLVQSEGGIDILTTSSKRLMEWMELNSPVLQVIASSMKGQWQMYNDFGLFTGIISTYILCPALNYQMPFIKLSNLVKLMSSVTGSLLESSNIKVKVDFSSIKNLLQVVQTIITSKPLCCSSTWTDVEALSLCVVGGFIHGFSEETNCLGRVSVLVEEGPSSEAPANFCGILYALPEGECKWNTLNNCAKKKILVVLFIENLSTNYQHGNGADSFAELSGTVPIDDIYLEDIPEGCIGEIETVEHIVRGHKSYLLLKRETSLKGVATISAFAPGEQEAAELKLVMHQCLRSLCHLYSYPFVYPGSGCLEMWLAEELQNSVLQEMDKFCDEYQCSKLEILTVLRWFRSSFLRVSRNISGSTGPISVMDSVYHHCWSDVGASVCNCGLVNRNSLEDIGSECLFVEIDYVEENLDSLSPLKKLEEIKCKSGFQETKTPALKLTDSAHVDVMSSKLNAYKLAFETCQSILEIGMIVY